MFRNVQIRSKLRAMLAVPLLALVGLSATQVVGGVRGRLEAGRLDQATQLASSTVALLDRLQRERASSLGEAASGAGANHETVIADRALSDHALESFQRERWLPAQDGLSAPLRRDLDQASARLGDLSAFRSRVQTRSAAPLQVADDYGGPIGALLAVIADLGTQPGSSLLGRNVDALVAAARAKEAASQAQGLLFSALTAGTFGAAEYRRFASLGGEQRAWLAQFRQAATPRQREFLDRTVTGPDVDRTEATRQAALAARDLPGGIAPTGWLALSSLEIDLLRGVELRMVGDLAGAGAAARAAADRRAAIDLAIALVVALALGWSLLLGRSLARPLAALERRAGSVASTELPRMLARLARAGEPGELASIAGEAGRLPIRSHDEIGRLAGAFNSVQRLAVRAASEHAALRRSIGDMVVNLARRNQSLIDRQLGLIEELERRSADPGQLDELFQLDHLATRMRRNAENLLVLASARPGRRWSEPIALADVLRAAASEVGDRSRVEIISDDGLRLLGHARQDVVHLLAELIENAICFSPPDTTVRVAAEAKAAGYLVEIEDRGLGMTEDEMSSINQRLANPPEIDFARSRMLGFFVVGRLAERHGIQVRLRPSWYGGVTALVMVPSSLLLAEREAARSRAEGPAPAPAQLVREGVGPAAEPATPVAWPERRQAVPGRSLFEPPPSPS